jgi:hypothetical protein
MFAVKEGKISSVEATIAGFGWALRPADRTITFRHLANMTSGYALPENPGTHSGYNDYAISLYVKTLFPKVFKQKLTSSRAARIALARSSSRMAPSSAPRAAGMVSSPHRVTSPGSAGSGSTRGNGRTCNSCPPTTSIRS